MLTKSFYSLLFLFFSIHTFAQDLYKTKLDQFVHEQKQEKIYVHFDKSQYAAGENMWFKAYITSAVSHLPTNVSSTLYIELIDGNKNVIDSLTLFIENGSTHGNFNLSRNLKQGNYCVRAYTEWMRNFDNSFFYKKNFTIINPTPPENQHLTGKTVLPSKKYVIDFLPEGGDLIAGIPTKVAIKATDIYGKGILANGVIINGKGKGITVFETNNFGYGLCFFKPEFGESYFALIAEDTTHLPIVKNAGASIKLSHSLKSENLLISILSKNIDLMGGTLVVHRRGQFLLSQKCSNKSSFAARIKKSLLKTGIIHLTFFDKNGLPLTERLVFPNPPLKRTDVSIASEKSTYKTRSEIKIELSTRSDFVQSASLTINPQSESSYNHTGENIENYLLLTSDLKGRIESPDYYFEDSEESYMDLDLLMLTNGWSRFDWASLLNPADFSPEFYAEKGLKIVGQAINFYSKKSLKDAKLGISVPSIGILNEMFDLSQDGYFEVADLKLMDSTNIYLQLFEEKRGKTKKYPKSEIKLENPSRPEIETENFSAQKINPEFIEKANKLDQVHKIYFFDEQATELEEIIITAKNIVQSEMDQRTLYTEPSDRIILDSLDFLPAVQSVFELLRRFPGVSIQGIYPDQSVMIRGSSSFYNNEALYVLDGIPVGRESIQALDIQNIQFVDVLKGARASIYGSRGAGGVILVYTRRGAAIKTNSKSPSGFLAFTHPGYYQTKEFYSPRYDTPKEEHSIPDFRTTLYWEPELNFENGKSKINFYSSDQIDTYTIRVEGIFKNGEPFFEEHFIHIN